MHDTNWNCLSIKELEEFLGKELTDEKVLPLTTLQL